MRNVIVLDSSRSMVIIFENNFANLAQKSSPDRNYSVSTECERFQPNNDTIYDRAAPNERVRDHLDSSVILSNVSTLNRRNWTQWREAYREEHEILMLVFVHRHLGHDSSSDHRQND